jgi:hypothetical protein
VDELPHWDRGTPGVLCVSGPHAIPVSTAVRAGDRRLLLALGAERETLAKLRQDRRAAFCLMGTAMAFTAYGEAAVIREGLDSAPGVVAVELRVDRVQDHLADRRTELLEGARWRWREERWAEQEEAIVEELQAHGGR